MSRHSGINTQFTTIDAFRNRLLDLKGPSREELQAILPADARYILETDARWKRVETNNAFTASTKANGPTVLADIVRDVQCGDVVSFVQGMATLSATVRQHAPSVLFIPERGCSPMSAALGYFERISPRGAQRRVYLPIGSYSSPADWNERRGLCSTTNKERVIRRIVEGYINFMGEAQAKDLFERPLLIDEVQSGSTSTQAMHIVSRLMYEYFGVKTCYYVGVQDNRDHTRARTDQYVDLMTGQPRAVEVPRRIVASQVNLALFTVDRNRMLDTIVGWECPTCHGTDLVVLPNRQAYEAVSFLMTAGRNTRAIIGALRSFEQSHGAPRYDFPECGKGNPALSESEVRARDEIIPYIEQTLRSIENHSKKTIRPRMLFDYLASLVRTSYEWNEEYRSDARLPRGPRL